KSQYTYENVAISSGGRLALTRLVSTLGRVNVGHFIPDYTAYEELLDAFGTFVPIPIPLKPERGYAFDVRELEEQILSFGLSAVLLSNPCNPTGKLIAGGALNSWVGTARKLSCNLIIDEFYSHYIYSNAHLSVSAAQYVDDVNSDPVVLIDGLTKNWRYPGFRISWTVAPKEIIDGIASAGSFLDGGAARPMQLAALSLVKPEIADREARAIQQAFSKKRALLVRGLSDMGISVTPEPEGGFYCWGDLSFLPEELNNGWKLFSRALEVGVIIVPGTFFDINPGHRRGGHKSRFESFARFSFGPPEAELELGIEKLRSLLNRG
ncbi:MAG: pyridoxal phosphate-dependent aminotransferase, partial [bacterium]|nr:pyridoxal phosphate-dependent aminotransferase [bacterium]